MNSNKLKTIMSNKFSIFRSLIKHGSVENVKYLIDSNYLELSSIGCYYTKINFLESLESNNTDMVSLFISF